MRRSGKAMLLAAAVGLMAVGGCTTSATGISTRQDASSTAVKDLRDYVRGQHTTGFLVVQHGKTLISENWPAPADRMFAIFDYGQADDGSLFEDVASQQKSFVSVLIAVAIDRGVIDVDKPVSDYIGTGWSKASPAQEAKIRIIDVLTMSSGLDEKFAYRAPPGSTFLYNTAVYAISKKVLSAAADKPLEDITREWLTAPLGMADTAWRQRPAALAGVGNPTGLVTTPADSAKFGLMILHGGVAADGTRIVSQANLAKMFERSAANPAYGRLWWLNGGDYVMGAAGNRRAGQLIAAAPSDLVAALGFLDRRIYIVPSLDLVVVRTGAAASDDDFDQQLWLRLMRVVG